MWNLLYISSYGIDMDFIHLLVLFEHWSHVHLFRHECHICLFVLFKHKCCMSICVVYTQKSCTRCSCLNNAWHSCLNNMNLWNIKLHIDLEWTHEAYKFVMNHIILSINTCKTTSHSILEYYPIPLDQHHDQDNNNIILTTP
jgi:hypothetical protein